MKTRHWGSPSAHAELDRVGSHVKLQQPVGRRLTPWTERADVKACWHRRHCRFQVIEGDDPSRILVDVDRLVAPAEVARMRIGEELYTEAPECVAAVVVTFGCREVADPFAHLQIVADEVVVTSSGRRTVNGDCVPVERHSLHGR